MNSNRQSVKISMQTPVPLYIMLIVVGALWVVLGVFSVLTILDNRDDIKRNRDFLVQLKVADQRSIRVLQDYCRTKGVLSIVVNQFSSLVPPEHLQALIAARVELSDNRTCREVTG